MNGAPTIGKTNLFETLWYLQKIAFSVLVLLIFERYIKTIPKIIDLLANYAFSIFFIHGYLLFEMWVIAEKFNLKLNSLPAVFLVGAVCFVLTLVICCSITFVVKKVAGARSRYILGS